MCFLQNTESDRLMKERGRVKPRISVAVLPALSLSIFQPPNALLARVHPGRQGRPDGLETCESMSLLFIEAISSILNSASIQGMGAMQSL